MLRRILTVGALAAALLAPSEATAQVAHVVTASCGSTGGGDCTTSAVDTTGADYCAAWISHFNNGPENAEAVSLTDSESNVWKRRLLTPEQSDTWGQLWEIWAPTTDASHTFTVDAIGSLQFPSLIVHCFSGISLMVTGAQTAAGTSVSAASVSLPQKVGLLLSGLVFGAAVTDLAVSGSFTTTTVAFSASNHMGASFAYLITDTGAQDPTWSWTNSVVAITALVAVTTDDSGGGGGSGTQGVF